MPRMLSSRAAAVALAAAAVVVVCLSTLAPVRAANPVEICVGVVLPVTGPRNVEALRIIETLKMAAEDITNDPHWLPGTFMHVITDVNLIDSAGFLPYVGKRTYNQIVSARCENGTSPIAIIGDLDDALVGEQSAIGTLLDTPIISPGTRDPVFSLDYVDNPFVVVMRPSINDEAQAMLAMFRRFGWAQVVLWHSNSQFGTALTDTFAGSGLEMLDVPIPSDDQGIEIKNAISRITTLRFRIIIVHAEPELARLMMNLSYRAGMLNGDYLFFGSSTWTYGTDTDFAVFNEQEKEYLQGVVGMGMLIPSGPAAAFSARLGRRNPRLYPPNFPEGPMATRVAAYNSLKSVAVAVKNLTGQGLAYTGDALMNALIGPDIDYASVTGERVLMNDIQGNIVSEYTILNFQGGEFVSIGQWSLASGVTFDTPIVWPGFNYEANPSQVVPRRTLVASDTLSVVAVVLAVLYGLVSLALHYLIYLNHNHEVIKASSPIFCHIILFGGDISYLMSGLSALGQEQTCVLVPALISLCFSLVFGALVAKTYRIHRIFNSAELRIKTPTNSHLFLICGSLVAYDLIIILLWSTTDLPHAAFVDSPNDPTTAYCTCVMKDATSWAMSLFIPKAALVLYGAYLAYKVRDLNHNFNEARYISLALYNVLLLASLCYGLVSAFPYGVDVVYACKTFGSATVAFITMQILFAPKFWDVYITKDWIDYHSHSSYISGVLVHKSSKGSYAKAIAKHTGGSAVAPTADEKEGTAVGKPNVAVGNLTSGAGATSGPTSGTAAEYARKRTQSGGGSGSGRHHGTGGKKEQYVYVSDRNKPPNAGRSSPVGLSGKKSQTGAATGTTAQSPGTPNTRFSKISAGPMAPSSPGGTGTGTGTPTVAAVPTTVTGTGAGSTKTSGRPSAGSPGAVGAAIGGEGVVTVNIGAPALGAPPAAAGDALARTHTRTHSSRSPTHSPGAGAQPIAAAVLRSPPTSYGGASDFGLDSGAAGAVVGSTASASATGGYRTITPLSPTPLAVQMAALGIPPLQAPLALHPLNVNAPAPIPPPAADTPTAVALNLPAAAAAPSPISFTASSSSSSTNSNSAFAAAGGAGGASSRLPIAINSPPAPAPSPL